MWLEVLLPLMDKLDVIFKEEAANSWPNCVGV